MSIIFVRVQDLMPIQAGAVTSGHVAEQPRRYAMVENDAAVVKAQLLDEFTVQAGVANNLSPSIVSTTSARDIASAQSFPLGAGLPGWAGYFAAPFKQAVATSKQVAEVRVLSLKISLFDSFRNPIPVNELQHSSASPVSVILRKRTGGESDSQSSSHSAQMFLPTSDSLLRDVDAEYLIWDRRGSPVAMVVQSADNLSKSLSLIKAEHGHSLSDQDFHSLGVMVHVPGPGEYWLTVKVNGRPLFGSPFFFEYKSEGGQVTETDSVPAKLPRELPAEDQHKVVKPKKAKKKKSRPKSVSRRTGGGFTVKDASAQLLAACSRFSSRRPQTAAARASAVLEKPTGPPKPLPDAILQPADSGAGRQTGRMSRSQQLAASARLAKAHLRSTLQRGGVSRPTSAKLGDVRPKKLVRPQTSGSPRFRQVQLPLGRLANSLVKSARKEEPLTSTARKLKKKVRRRKKKSKPGFRDKLYGVIHNAAAQAEPPSS